MASTTNAGHAPIRPEDLLEHSAWLRRLAATLVRGEADADDLVQETYLAALRHPPLDDRPLRGWLTQVARNAGRMQARGDGRRARRDAEGIPGADDHVPQADVLLARLAAQRRLSALVSELEEPFRTTVLLRYFEGLSSAEIARDQKVPEGTVRWRLKTGLDRLRTQLDRENGGDRKAWCLLLGPLVDRKGGSRMMAKGITKGIWGANQAIKLLFAGVVTVGSVAGWVRFGPGHGSDTATVTTTGKSAAARRTRTSGTPALPGAATLTLPDATAEKDPSAAHGAFEGRIVNWSTGQGVPGAEVTFSIDGTTSVTTADEEGYFEIVPTRSGRSRLAMVTAEGYLPFAPDLGHSPFELFARPGMRVRDLTVQLVPALEYTGVVLDAKGEPVAGAAVTLLGAGQGERTLHPIDDHFVSDEHGEFHFHAQDYAVLEARHPVLGVGRGKLADAALVSHRLTLKLATGDAVAHLGTERIAGRVVDADGAPVAGAFVKAHPTSESAHTSNSPSGQATTDASGRFAIEGLDPGTHALLAQHAGYASATADGVSTGAADVVLDLRRGSSLSGRVVEAAGRAPLPAFNVIVSRRDGPVKEVSVVSQAVVDAEGRFTIPDLGPGDYRVRAGAYGHATSGPVEVTLAGTAAGPLEIALGRGGKLVGKLVEAEGGAPIKGARLSIPTSFDGSTAAPAVINALTNEQGDFELVGVPSGPQSVTIGAYAHNMRIVSGLKFEEGITTGPVTLDLTRPRDGEQPHMELAGVGATLHADGDGLRIEKVIPGGGAIEVGLAPGDTILAVDGTSIASLGMDEAITRIRGPEGSTVRLTVRKADGTVTDVLTARRRIHV